jgi:hypothetical protein
VRELVRQEDSKRFCLVRGRKNVGEGDIDIGGTRERWDPAGEVVEYGR